MSASQQATHPLVVPGSEKPTTGGLSIGHSIGSLFGRAFNFLFGSKKVAADGSASLASVNRKDDLPKGPCSREMEEFLQCSREESNIDSDCDGYNDAFRKCMSENYLD